MLLFVLIINRLGRSVRLQTYLFPRILLSSFIYLFGEYPALSDRPVVDTWVGALDATIEASKEHISTLDSQVVLRDLEIALNLAQADNLQGCIKIAEGPYQVFATTRKHSPHLGAAEEACYSE